MSKYGYTKHKRSHEPDKTNELICPHCQGKKFTTKEVGQLDSVIIIIIIKSIIS